MSLDSRLEVQFYSQEEAGLFIETNCDDMKCLRVETSHAVFYTLRQAVNAGKDYCYTIGEMLGEWCEAYDNYFSGHAEFPYSDKVAVVPYRGAGRYSFHSTFSEPGLIGKGLRFKLKPKGFGLLARGINYYGPTSTLLIWMGIAQRYDPGPDPFKKAFGFIVGSCAAMLMDNQVTTFNQADSAFEIIRRGWEAASEHNSQPG